MEIFFLLQQYYGSVNEETIVFLMMMYRRFVSFVKKIHLLQDDFVMALKDIKDFAWIPKWKPPIYENKRRWKL